MQTHFARYVAIGWVALWVGIAINSWGQPICTTGSYIPDTFTMIIFALTAPIFVLVGFNAGRESGKDSN